MHAAASRPCPASQALVLDTPARPADAIAAPPHPHRVAGPRHALADPRRLPSSSGPVHGLANRKSQSGDKIQIKYKLKELLVPTVAFLCSFTSSSKTFEPVDDVDEDREDSTC